MAKALVIGGGIVGLSSAYYLLQSGWQVTVADRGDFTNNCSYGNAGYICPSHFVPLASPGIIKQGLRWMLNPQSPFYIKPRLNWGLLQWGWQFMRSATPAHLQRSEVPLRDIALLSKQLYEEWLTLPGFEFAYERKGLLEYFQTPEKEAAAHHHAHAAAALGLEAKVLTAAETQTLEPHVDLNVKGALYFGCDAHLHPNRVMQQMHAYLKNAGVEFLANSPVTSFEKQGGKVMAANAGKTRLQADIMVVASGSWSRQVAHALGLNLLLVGGRGYSFTFNHGHLPLQYPAVLMEGRVALTPFGDGLVRLGGTMEIT
ncbi:MAG TPA: FAD-dependent oxidoreductase, partial [Phnomibacter sp.]|nr:FAD-dependent oxidoreductase [Phnomibacter sp.]